MNDIIAVQQEIDKYIRTIEKHCAKLESRAKEKALAVAEYDKKLAITIMELRLGVAKELDGVAIKDPPVTIIEKIAKGLCWQDKLCLDKAETQYKLTITKINAAEACLNGEQSIYRHLENKVRN